MFLGRVDGTGIGMAVLCCVRTAANMAAVSIHSLGRGRVVSHYTGPVASPGTQSVRQEAWATPAAPRYLLFSGISSTGTLV